MSTVSCDLLDKSRGKKKPVYQQIVHHVREMIKANSIKPGEYLPPTAEFAKSWKVGYSTVGSALEMLEEEGLISRGTMWGKGPVVLKRDKIMSKCMIAFPRWCGSAQFMALEAGAKRYAKENDIILTTIDAMEDSQVYLDLFNHPSQDIKGMLVFPWDSPEYRDAVSVAIDKGIKVVFVDRVIPVPGVSSVSMDHFSASCAATTHLIETHNRPVYYFGYTDKPSSSHQRFQGYLEAMHEVGYDSDENSRYVIRRASSEEESSRVFRRKDFLGLTCDFASKFFDTHNESKYSIIGVNDDMARGVCMAAEKAGLKVGQNVFVCGFSNKPYCKRLPVPLTSVEQFDERTGYEAAKLLHNTIIGKQKRVAHIILSYELCIRQSSTGQK